MFKNYLLTAWRQILKNRLFSLINIVGLAIGMMSCILIMLFVRDELNYDRFIPDGERVVRLHSAFYPPGRQPFLTVRSAGRMMEAIRDYASAEVEAGVRIFGNQTTILHDGDAYTDPIAFADGSLFEVIQLPFVHGSAETSFKRPNDLVVTEEIAIKYFGRTDVVGETLVACCMRGQQMPMVISGVIKDVPEASHFSFGLIFYLDPPMFDFAPNILNTWTSVNVYTYFKLREGVTAAQLKERIYTWLDTESIFTENDQVTGKPSDVIKPNVVPLHDLHLHARKDAGNMGDFTTMGDVTMVYTFTSVAALILLIASINFMNLSTAKATKRSHEVAMRKVVGATRTQVAFQFLGEALGIALAALAFALVAVELVLPIYNEAIGKQLSLSLLGDMPLLLSLLASAVVIGLISGSYPAMYVSRFLPARILKSETGPDAQGRISFRTILVVFQFAISIGLIICTIVVYGQTLYAQSVDLGYSKENKLAVTSIDDLASQDQVEPMRAALARLPGVESVVLSSEVPSQDNENNTGFTRTDNDENAAATNPAILNYHSVDFGFFEAYGIAPVAGRLFDRAFGAEQVLALPEDDENAVGKASLVLNESAVRSLGFSSPQAAIGQGVSADVFRVGNYDFTIVGVVPDVYFRSLKFGVRPSVYWISPRAFGAATVTYSGVSTEQLIEQVEALWREQAPQTPVAHQFVSDMLAAQYDQEDRQAQLFAAFAALAVVVACLGLYGLAAFNAEQRIKEIGIRKVLGATVMDIVRLMVWQFSRPVLLANLIAWPVAGYFMLDWLSQFHYRLDDTYVIWTAISAGIAGLLVAWLTVAGRALSAAQGSPIAAMRQE